MSHLFLTQLENFWKKVRLDSKIQFLCMFFIFSVRTISIYGSRGRNPASYTHYRLQKKQKEARKSKYKIRTYIFSYYLLKEASIYAERSTWNLRLNKNWP